MRGSVIQEWLAERCTWKQKTVLLAAFRGCDGLPKHDPGKAFAKRMRATILKNADASTTFYGPAVRLDADGVDEIHDFFAGCLDAYPVHWIIHFLHAAEIAGYKHPDPHVRLYWYQFYLCGVVALHLNPETEEQLDVRLADAEPADPRAQDDGDFQNEAMPFRIIRGLARFLTLKRPRRLQGRRDPVVAMDPLG